LAGICVSATSALATWMPGDGAIIVSVTAEQSGASETRNWVFVPGSAIDGVWNWQLAAQDGPTDGTLGRIDNLAVSIDTDPAVSLNFAVVAGLGDTTFTINSAAVNFPAIWHPLGYATAGITVTDNDGNGATVTGLYDGGKAYEARYNGATAWAHLVSTTNTIPNTTLTTSERKPGTSRLMIADTLTSIESSFKFKLSAEDSASGTSRFDVIVPEPVTALLLIGGLPLMVRRRSR
jgi:hypothetical protein